MKALLALMVAVLVAMLWAVALIEWVAGCGETYIDAKGERHEYACVFINR